MKNYDFYAELILAEGYFDLWLEIESSNDAAALAMASNFIARNYPNDARINWIQLIKR